MDTSLREALRNALDVAYPHRWSTARLSLPLGRTPGDSPFRFQVMCSDLASLRHTVPAWPPCSRDPKAWLRWEPSPSAGFWIRPRKDDPILRDRFILLGPLDVVESLAQGTITAQALIDACVFAIRSGRLVWHNPPKGGARSPESAHFQTIPLTWEDGDTGRYTVPCCLYEADPIPWTSAGEVRSCVLERGFRRCEYPVLGLAVWGSIEGVADRVWHVIWRYDAAQACNLIIQPGGPSHDSEVVRVFVFPRARTAPRQTVTADLLKEDEMILMRNRRGGAWGDWSFAGVEMGLLTQVEWGTLFEEMRSRPVKWGGTLLRLLQGLTLKENDDDWLAFRSICESVDPS